MTPQVSVIMPVYNAERYVAEAVESILAQTFTDFEFLIIDDGSTDSSLEILRRYASRDARIRLTSRPNTGYVVALNEMLEQARGEFIARMDADDCSLTQRLAHQVKAMSTSSALVAVGTKVLLIDPEDNALCVAATPSDHESIDKQNLDGCGSAIAHPSVMLRASAIRRVGGYDAAFWPAEDVDLFLKLAENGRLSNLEYVGLKYRVHEGSTGHLHRAAQVAAAQRASNSACRRRGLPAPRWPPEATGGAREDCRVLWAWWALRGNQIQTARRYALRAFLENPCSLHRAKLLACALRGR